MGESWGDCQPHDVIDHESDRVGSDWAYLSDLAEVNPRSPLPTDGETVSFVAMADVSESGVIDNVELRKTSTGYTPFAVGDVLVAKITPCFENGKGAHVRDLPTRCGLGSTEFHVLRPRSTTSDRYLYHLTRISEFRLQGEGLMSGSAGQRRVPTEFFSRYAVRMPPLEEQRRIAEILDSIDETIQATEHVIAKRRMILTGLQESLLKEDSCASRTTIGDLVSHHWPGEWGNAAPSHGFQEAIVLRSTNLDDYGVDYSTGARRFVVGPKVADKRLRDGDLLVEAAGGGPGVPVGRVRRFQQPAGDTSYLTSNFFRTLRPKAGVDPDYLFWLLDREYRKPSIWSCQQQTTGIINLKVRDYLERPVSNHRGSQVEIAGALDKALETVEAERRQLQKLQETRAGLAADLLSGRVRTVAA